MGFFKKGKLRKTSEKRGNRDGKNELNDANGKPQKTGFYGDMKKENELFQKYYESIHGQEKFQLILETLREDLPTTFRINRDAYSGFIKSLIDTRYLSNPDICVVEKNVRRRLENITWYPDNLAYEFNISRWAFKKSPALKEFHKFLVDFTESGHISRQEAVSMIPPLLLDARPGEKILDLCYTLVRQSKRIRSPFLLVTHLDAQFFPSIFFKDQSVNPALPLQFDKILADVPCSGDGTLRKNLDIWKNWSPSNGNGLHKVQVSIVTRAMKLAKIGGTIVYSTCSMYPIENEAVVSAVLRRSNGALKLVDVKHKLPGLKVCNGLTSWVVMDRNGVIHDRYVDGVSEKLKLCKSMFCQDDVKNMNLQNCIRIEPQDQNTGGFFIAVLTKVTPYITAENMINSNKVDKVRPTHSCHLKAENENSVKLSSLPTEPPPSLTEPSPSLTEPSPSLTEPSPSLTEPSPLLAEPLPLLAEPSPLLNEPSPLLNELSPPLNESSPPLTGPSTLCTPKNSTSIPNGNLERPKKINDSSKRPFVTIESVITKNNLNESIRSHFGISDALPVNALVTHSISEDGGNIYLISPMVEKLLFGSDKIKLRPVSAGVRCIVRNGKDKSDPCSCRFSEGGINVIAHLVTNKKKIELNKEDLCAYLSEEHPKIEKFSNNFKEKFKDLSLGGCIGTIDLSTLNQSAAKNIELKLPLWVSKFSSSLLVKKEYRHMLTYLIS